MSFRRWWLPRRSVQLAVIALILSPLAGARIFQGNLASASLLGVKLADPLAFLQVVMATGLVIPAFAGSALLVAGWYWLIGGRTFCAWVCPVYLLTELADSIRGSFGSGARIFGLAGKQWLLVLTLAVSGATGLPLFEIVSPIGITTRAFMFGGGLSLLFLAGIVTVEMAFARRVWCRSLCPLGGFYALLGRSSPVKVRFAQQLCDGCGDCTRVCPVPEVLDPSLRCGAPLVSSGECTRCGRCIDICPTSALKPGVGYQ